jgi:predicted signal transduction protein with EAL and GGDEF domain
MHSKYYFDAAPLMMRLAIANRIRNDVEAFRYQWGEDVFSISASVGLGEIPGGEISLATGVNEADAACMAAKRGGRNRVHILRSDDETVVQLRNEMLYVNQITNALEQSRFELFYQDIVPLKPGLGTGKHHENLLRMLDLNGGIVLPNDCLPAVERYQPGACFDMWVASATLTPVVSDPQALWQLDSCSIYSTIQK